jgi:hypothetical protein
VDRFTTYVGEDSSGCNQASGIKWSFCGCIDVIATRLSRYEVGCREATDDDFTR